MKSQDSQILHECLDNTFLFLLHFSFLKKEDYYYERIRDIKTLQSFLKSGKYYCPQFRDLKSQSKEIKRILKPRFPNY